jgi:hypothetical protein
MLYVFLRGRVQVFCENSHTRATLEVHPLDESHLFRYHVEMLRIRRNTVRGTRTGKIPISDVSDSRHPLLSVSGPLVSREEVESSVKVKVGLGTGRSRATLSFSELRTQKRPHSELKRPKVHSVRARWDTRQNVVNETFTQNYCILNLYYRQFAGCPLQSVPKATGSLRYFCSFQVTPVWTSSKYRYLSGT